MRGLIGIGREKSPGGVDELLVMHFDISINLESIVLIFHKVHLVNQVVLNCVLGINKNHTSNDIFYLV